MILLLIEYRCQSVLFWVDSETDTEGAFSGVCDETNETLKINNPWNCSIEILDTGDA